MKRLTNKLNLYKMTISNLNSREMGQMAGGVLVKSKPVFGNDGHRLSHFRCTWACVSLDGTCNIK